MHKKCRKEDDYSNEKQEIYRRKEIHVRERVQIQVRKEDKKKGRIGVLKFSKGKNKQGFSNQKFILIF